MSQKHGYDQLSAKQTNFYLFHDMLHSRSTVGMCSKNPSQRFFIPQDIGDETPRSFRSFHGLLRIGDIDSSGLIKRVTRCFEKLMGRETKL